MKMTFFKMLIKTTVVFGVAVIALMLTNTIAMAKKQKNCQIKCCGLHEVPIRSSKCYNENTARTCKNLINPNHEKLPCRRVTCDCKSHYYRNAYGKCVPKHECYENTNATYEDELKYCFRENETPDGCYDPFLPRTCANRHKIESGKYKRDKCIYCIYGKCECKPRFFRNSAGNCVPESKCDYDDLSSSFESSSETQELVCFGPNEERVELYDSCAEKRCPGVGCFIYKRLTPGCQCVEGYVRNNCQQCVKETFCNWPCECTDPCSEPYEVYRSVNTCTERKCRCPGIQFKCTVGAAFKCDCIDGYRRSLDGKCRPEKIACRTYEKKYCRNKK